MGDKEVAVKNLSCLPRVIDGDETIAVVLLHMDETGILEGDGVGGFIYQLGSAPVAGTGNQGTKCQ